MEEQMSNFEEKFTVMEERIETLEKKLKVAEEELFILKQASKQSEIPEGREWASNSASDFSIKVVYPAIYTQGKSPTAGFPKNRRKTAEQVSPGQFMFMYATTPIKKIIGMTKVTSMMKEVDGQWPYSVDLEWLIGPKQGVTFADAGLDIRPRVGDTLYAISEEAGQRIIMLLNAQPDISEDTLAYLAEEYRHLYTAKESVPFSEAIRRLLENKMDEAAGALEREGRDKDGTTRGWDEKIERGELYRRFPKAREIIWPTQYGQ